jgi:hypothetical protein
MLLTILFAVAQLTPGQRQGKKSTDYADYTD